MEGLYRSRHPTYKGLNILPKDFSLYISIQVYLFSIQVFRYLGYLGLDFWLYVCRTRHRECCLLFPGLLAQEIHKAEANLRREHTCKISTLRLAILESRVGSLAKPFQARDTTSSQAVLEPSHSTSSQAVTEPCSKPTNQPQIPLPPLPSILRTSINIAKQPENKYQHSQAA